MLFAEFIQGKITDVFELMLTEGAHNFQLAAAESLLEQQFEVLLASAKGIHTLAQKYASNSQIYNELKQSEDSLFRTLGLLPEDYAAALDELDLELDRTLKQLTTSKQRERAIQEHNSQIVLLRERLGVDKHQRDLFNRINNNEDEKFKLLKSFKSFMEDNWVEADIEHLQQKNHETKKEFRVRVELNQHLKTYHEMLRPYQDGKKKILQRSKDQSEALISSTKGSDGQTLRQKLDTLDEALHQSVAQSKKHWAEVEQGVKAILDLEELTSASPEEIMEFIQAKLEAYKNQAKEDKVAKDVEKIIGDNLRSLSQRVDSLIAHSDALSQSLQDHASELCLRGLSDALEKTQQEHDQNIQSVYALVQPELLSIEAEKDRALDELYQTHELDIEKADEFYTLEIAFRKRVLKCEQVNKLFAAYAATLPKLIDNLSELDPALDSYTVAFFAHLQECFDSQGTLMNIVHLAGEVGADYIEAALQENKSDASTAENMSSVEISHFVLFVANEVISQVESAAHLSLDQMGFAALDNLKRVADYFYDTACIQTPEWVEVEGHYIPTLLDFMPSEIPEPVPSLNKDALEELEVSQTSWLSMPKKMYQVYSALVSENSKTCLQDASDPASLLFASLEDERNDMYLELLNVVQRGYASLLNSKTLDSDHQQRLGGLLSQVESLQKQRELLVERFEEIVQAGEQKRQEYAKVKKAMDAAQQEMEGRKITIDHLEKEIRKLELLANKQKGIIAEKGLNRAQQRHYEKECQVVDEHHLSTLEALEQTFEDNASALLEKRKDLEERALLERDSALGSFDAETQNQINQLIIQDYATKATAQSYITPYYANLVYAKTFSQEALDDWLNANPDLQATVEELRKLRVLELNRIHRNYEVNRASIIERYEASLAELQEEYEKDQVEAKTKHFQDKLQLMPDYNLALKQAEEKLLTYQDQIKNLQVRLHENKSIYDEAQEKYRQLKKQASILSRDYYETIDAYKKDKAWLIKQSKALIKNVLDLDPKECVELISLRTMVAQVFNGANMFRFADILKNTVLNKFSYTQMDVNHILRKHVEEREVRDVTACASEQTRLQLLKNNMTDLAAQSAVKMFCAKPLKHAKMFVQHLEPTLEAKKQLKEQQSMIDDFNHKKAKKPEKLLEGMRPNPYQFPTIRDALENIGRSLKFFFKALSKGVAFAAVAEIVDLLKLPNPLKRKEEMVEDMFERLQGITNIRHRAQALEKISKVLEPMKQKGLDPAFVDKLECEELKMKALTLLSKNKSGAKGSTRFKFFSRTAMGNHELDKAMVHIRKCSDTNELNDYIQSIGASHYPLHQILTPIRDELAHKKPGFEPKPGDRVMLKR